MTEKKVYVPAMRKIGTPPMTLDFWLDSFAGDNEVEAKRSWWNPLARAKYTGQAWAFRVALGLLLQATSPPPKGERLELP